jgi:hypothetical protein
MTLKDTKEVSVIAGINARRIIYVTIVAVIVYYIDNE